MAIKRPPLSFGPGSLIFGSGTGASLLDISCQVTAAKITFDFDKEDDLPTLCGDTIPGEEVTSATLEFSAAQDTEKDGMTDWTWKNSGKQVPFTLIPKEGESAAVAGIVTVRATEFGGDVKKRNISDAEWPIVGMPSFTPDSTADSTEYPPAPTP